MPKFKAWVNAARLRTLPLSLSGIIVGTAIADLYGYFDWLIFILALCTTISFQVTSNFANDYGDGVKGTDNEDRIGPKRALQSGILSRASLKKGILIAIIIDFILVIALVLIAFKGEQLKYAVIFVALGALSIWASIKYTVGDSAYGYRGLGDAFVFVFFGLLGVVGSTFLYTKFIVWDAIFPAITIGLLSTAVLNLNNLRDFESDRKAGKNTVVVKMGFHNGKRYHGFLLIASLLSLCAFIVVHFQDWSSLLPLLAFIPIFIHLIKIIGIKDAALLDPELKKVALSTFLLALLFYFGFNIFL